MAQVVESLPSNCEPLVRTLKKSQNKPKQKQVGKCGIITAEKIYTWPYSSREAPSANGA
jgi:hypothetical protein